VGVSWLTEPDEDGDQPEVRPRSRLKLLAAVFAGWLAVSLIVLLSLLTFTGRHSARSPAGAPSTGLSGQAAATASGSPTGGSPTESLPDGWVERASDDQSNCAAHSYGQVQVFFARTRCSSVHRTLSTTEQDGRTVVVAASAVTFATAEQAASYLRLVASDGTGNINDLLREGSRYPGSPSKLPVAAFASRRDGIRVLVAEAAFAEGASGPADPTLQAVARRAVDSG
jgi:hypothetical protein